MNVSSTSSTSGNQALWSMLSAKAEKTGSSSHYSASTTTSGTQASTESRPPPPPPGPPPGADSLGAGMSTSQFASLSSLDADSDGQVSGEEYGLSTADDHAAELFSKVDSNGDGSLGSDEVSAFESMMQSQGPQGANGPPPPPPPDQDQNAGSQQGTPSGASDATNQLLSLLKDLLQRYGDSNGSSVSDGQLSVSA